MGTIEVTTPAPASSPTSSPSPWRQLSIPQAVLGFAAIAGVVVMAALHVCSGDAAVAVVSTIGGGAVGYVNGKKAAGGA
jgi:hypothetical protein